MANEPKEVRRVLDAIEAVARIDDAGQRGRILGELLKEWPGQQAKLRKMRQEVVAELRAEGRTYRDIATVLGVAVSRVKQIEQGESWKKTPKKSAPAPDES